ncbi:Crp/Fnr family transcriptional regulator [Chitinophaga japonensis]|uniref:CRP-like cAMP-binding protein n=1 Tax=Chitinophaga japonensis TaxID=104662 RepID=A0A562SI55_CHIJA|nr:Crp/Fnr family transcriptional regulator [Chitinophaga japonensis]TWI80965.1 CRP-like cAMP-binding protein [Chitinophaga japonensis]
MEKLQDIFSNIGIAEPDVAQILARFDTKTFAKNEYLLQAGQVATSIFFVERGSILLGQEVEDQSVTRHLAREGAFITCLDSFSRQAPTAEFLKATDPSIVHCIHQTDFAWAQQQFPAIATFFQQYIFQTLLKCQQRITDLISLDAKAYYKEIMQRSPDYIQHMPQYDLASYMGIEPQSLSRIRKES